LSRQLDKQQPAQDNSCLAPIFLKIRTHALCPEKPPGSPELSLANFWSQIFEIIFYMYYMLFSQQEEINIIFTYGECHRCYRAAAKILQARQENDKFSEMNIR
jgi:hypothetical protein